MTDLPYQTFGSTNRVFVGADAQITTSRAANGEFVHHVDISDFAGRHVLSLCLTSKGVADLYGVLAALMPDPDPTPWADLDMARLGATGVVAFT